MEILLSYYAYFIIYAFLGWCCEVGFAAAVEGRFVNRGFLNGPVCPIYGVGAVLVISALSPLSGSLTLLFIGAVVLTSALEWFTGFVLEKFFHEKWWDYTDQPFNIGGYICLKFSLLWGAACCIVVKAVHPLFVLLVRSLPHPVLVILLCIAGAAFIADISVTVAELLKLKKNFRLIDDTERRLRVLSDKIGKGLADKVLDGKKLAESKEAEELISHCRKVIDDAEKYRKSHLIKAFPNLDRKRSKPLSAIREYLEKQKEKHNLVK